MKDYFRTAFLSRIALSNCVNLGMCKDVSEITGIQACALNAGTHLNVLIRHLEVKAVILFMKISLDVLYVPVWCRYSLWINLCIYSEFCTMNSIDADQWNYIFSWLVRRCFYFFLNRQTGKAKLQRLACGNSWAMGGWEWHSASGWLACFPWKCLCSSGLPQNCVTFLYGKHFLAFTFCRKTNSLFHRSSAVS